MYFSVDGKRILTSVNAYSPEGRTYDTVAWDAATGRLLGDVPDRQAHEEWRVFPYLQFGGGGVFRTDLPRPVLFDSSGHRLLTQRGLMHTGDGGLLACGRFPG